MLVWRSFIDLLKSANKAKIYLFADFLLKKTGHVCGQEKRADRVITVCEIKHHNKKIGTHIIPEMERKCTLVKLPRGYAVECKSGEKNINPSLFYFMKRTPIPRFYQVHEGNRDYEKSGVRVLPVHTFCRELCLP